MRTTTIAVARPLTGDGPKRAAVFVGLLAVQPANAQDLKEFTFMFPVESVNQFHPFYIADKLGYFAEEGLKVTFGDAGGSSAAIQQVIAGNADAALPAPSAFLNAVAQGYDLKTVLGLIPGWFEDYNDNHPHSGLKMRSREFIAAKTATA